MRASWYQSMSRLLDNDEDGKLGHLVSVINLVDFDPQLVIEHAEVSKHSMFYCEPWPQRLLGQHICYNNPLMRGAMNFFERLVSTDQRLHMRFHYGE